MGRLHPNKGQMMLCCLARLVSPRRNFEIQYDDTDDVCCLARLVSLRRNFEIQYDDTDDVMLFGAFSVS